MFALIAAAALLAADAPPASADAATRQAYQQAKAQAGRSPDDQVRLAYWCEAHGLTAERMRHLAQAVLADPGHAAARGLLGLVARADRWVRPDAVAEQVRADPALAATLEEYDARRSKAAYTAEGQLALAHWADEHGLRDQAKAHYTAVVRLDPGRDAVWKRLGYKKHDGQWTTDAAIAAAKADSDAQKAADARWRPLLERWRGMLGKAATRGEAEAGLLTVTDPRATGNIARVFLTNRPADQMVAVRVLGQIDSAAASRLLAIVAISSASPEARRFAVETLRHRDPREFADLLISRLTKAIRYEVRPVGGPGSPGVVFIEGKQFNTQRVYAPPAFRYTPQIGDFMVTDNLGLPAIQRTFDQRTLGTGRLTGQQLLGMPAGELRSLLTDRLNPYALDVLRNPVFGQLGQQRLDQMILDQQSRATSLVNNLHKAIHDVGIAEHKNPTQYGFKISEVQTTQIQIPIGQMMLESQKTAIVAEQQLESDVRLLDAMNQQIRQNNDQIQQVLTGVTGVNFGDDAQQWKDWWVNQLGYAQSSSQEAPVPTFVENVPLAYQPQPVAPTFSVISSPVTFERFSCFAAGTLVKTLSGPMPIEILKVGDLVLTQSTSTGALGYQPITVTHHNPPSPTFRIKLGDDGIVASPFHRFWVARKGWVMARDLKAGDPVRTLGGVRPIDSVEAGPTQLVYNLDIADDADFFAGASAALVHDNTLPDPRLVPFDLPQPDGKAVAAK